jgi:hypothetical protein
VDYESVCVVKISKDSLVVERLTFILTYLVRILTDNSCSIGDFSDFHQPLKNISYSFPLIFLHDRSKYILVFCEFCILISPDTKP